MKALPALSGLVGSVFDHRQPDTRSARSGELLLLCCLLAPAAAGANGALDADIINAGSPDGPASELHIGRLVYQHGPHSSRGPGRAWWRIDWPEAEAHFTEGVARYTVIDVAPDSAHLTLLDDTVFDYPWLFVQQPGRWQLSDREVLRLRQYLQRGGFMVVDDFHGDADWQVFAAVMERVLPGHRVIDVEPDDPLMDVAYDLDQRTAIPGRRHLVAGDEPGTVGVRMPFAPARWRGIPDDAGRLMVAINFNMDMGDAWEHADDPVYPVAMTTLAYRFGINYLLYAMTH